VKKFKSFIAEAYQQFLDKSPSNWGEDKVVAYGTKKGHKVIGVCGHGRVEGIVLFGLDAGDKKYVGKEAKVKTGQTVFRYATRNSMAGDIFPLVKIDVKRGLLYNLSQKSIDGEIEHAEFESKSVKLRYLRLAATANISGITGFDPGFGSMKESVDLDEDCTCEELEITEAEYQGKSVTLNNPFRLPSGNKKKFGVYVTNKKGNIVKVTFGDPNMEIKRDDPERRKSFRARHNCADKKDKTTPGYWSCYQWRASAKVDN
jgi:hypothetical protein